MTAAPAIIARWYTSEPNWGDEINPLLIAGLSGRRVVFSKNPSAKKFVCVGSIMHIADAKTTVWGAGMISPAHPPKVRPLRVCAVRGPLTRDLLRAQNIPCPEVYGDPALLYPRVYNPPRAPRYRLGVIPHYVDKGHPALAALRGRDDVLVLDIQAGVNAFVDQLVQCERTISSALHGIVASDAYGIPTAWMILSGKLKGGDFKFLDYFASTGRPVNVLRVGEKTTPHPDGFFDMPSLPPPSIDLDLLLGACPFPVVKR